MDNKTIQPAPVSTDGQQTKADTQTTSGEAKGNPLVGAKKIITSNLSTVVIVAVIIVLAVLAFLGKGLVVAAMVNGSPISRLAVIKNLEKASGKALLDSLIVEKLVNAEASAKNITVSADEINTEIKIVEDQVTSQGSSLDEALAAQGMDSDDLRKQVILRKEMEKLLADKVKVTDQEVAQYILDNGIKVVKGDEAATNDQIRSELSSQKFSTEAQTFIADLKAKAKIQYFVNY